MLPGGKKLFSELENWVCSGVLLNSHFVLTAAHCINPDDGSIKLKLGVHRINGYGPNENGNHGTSSENYQTFDIPSENFVKHENFTMEKNSVRNDIALIKLPRPVQMNRQTQPVCWKKQASHTMNENLVVVGWGKTNASQTSANKINGLYSTDQYKLEVKSF